MADDTPLGRLNEEAKLRAAIARHANAPRTTVPTTKPTTLEEEYERQRAAGLHKDDPPLVTEPTRHPSTVDRDLAAHVAAVVSQILSVP